MLLATFTFLPAASSELGLGWSCGMANTFVHYTCLLAMSPLFDSRADMSFFFLSVDNLLSFVIDTPFRLVAVAARGRSRPTPTADSACLDFCLTCFLVEGYKE